MLKRKQNMSKYELYLNLVREMCERLEKTDINKLTNEDIWDAALMRLQVIGENLKKIPKKLKEKSPEVKWENFEWFRNQISHEYKIVLREVVKDLIKKIPELKNSILKMKKELKNYLKMKLEQKTGNFLTNSPKRGRVKELK